MKSVLADSTHPVAMNGVEEWMTMVDPLILSKEHGGGVAQGVSDRHPAAPTCSTRTGQQETIDHNTFGSDVTCTASRGHIHDSTESTQKSINANINDSNFDHIIVINDSDGGDDDGNDRDDVANAILKSGEMTVEPMPLADTINENDLNQFFADERTQGPLRQRQQVEDDSRGNILPPIEEAEEFLCAKLDEMEVELSNITCKFGYDMAMQRNPEYAQGRPLRAMFLRSESYDAERAARRFVAWYDSILVHFGPEALGRPLRLTDLSVEAYHLLTIGKFQLLPRRDSKGRFVMVFFKSTCDTYSDYAAVQLLHYLSSTAYGCDSIQRNGVVSVHKFDVVPGTPQEHINPTMSKVGKMTHLMALRLEHLHYVGNQQQHRDQALIHKVQSSVARDYHDRFHVHVDSNQRSNLDELLTYGIPTECIPQVDSAGELLSSDHMDWVMQKKISEGHWMLAPDSIMRYNNCNLDQLFIRTRMAKAASRGAKSNYSCHSNTACQPDFCVTGSDEASAESLMTGATSSSSSTSNISASTANVGAKDDSSNGPIIPTNDDVIMGRGHRYLQHPGNKFLRSIVADRSKEYDKASRPEKYDLAKDIVRIVYKKRGRFLKKDADNDAWSEATWCIAREKVAHAFRKRRELDLAKAKKAKTQAKPKLKLKPKLKFAVGSTTSRSQLMHSR